MIMEKKIMSTKIELSQLRDQPIVIIIGLFRIRRINLFQNWNESQK